MKTGLEGRYVVKNNKFQKIKIKVFARGKNIYINSYYDKERNMWYNGFNTNAYPVQKNDGVLRFPWCG